MSVQYESSSGPTAPATSDKQHQANLKNSYPIGFDSQFRDWLVKAGIGFQVLLSTPAAVVNQFYANAKAPPGQKYLSTANGPVSVSGVPQITPDSARDWIKAAWNENPTQMTWVQQPNISALYGPNGTGLKFASDQGDKTTVKQPNNALVKQPTAAGVGGSGVPAPPAYKSGDLARDLKSIGFNFPFDVKGFINDAIRLSNGDASKAMDIFKSELYKSAQFKHYYPSYFTANGTARYDSPASYDQAYEGYKTAATRQGFKLSRSQFGQVVGQSKSADEFTSDVQMAATIKKNSALLKNFSQMAAAQGAKGLHTAQDAFNFLTGRGDPKQYQVWNAAAAKTAAQEAGVQVGTKEAVAATSRLQAASAYTDIEKSYQDIAEQIKSSGAELGAFGLTTKDLETIQFGGAHRAILAARAQQAITQSQAQAQYASPQMSLVGNRPAIQENQKVGE